MVERADGVPVLIARPNPMTQAEANAITQAVQNQIEDDAAGLFDDEAGDFFIAGEKNATDFDFAAPDPSPLSQCLTEPMMSPLSQSLSQSKMLSLSPLTQSLPISVPSTKPFSLTVQDRQPQTNIKSTTKIQSAITASMKLNKQLMDKVTQLQLQVLMLQRGHATRRPHTDSKRDGAGACIVSNNPDVAIMSTKVTRTTTETTPQTQPTTKH